MFSDIEQVTLDIDWFFTNTDNIYHVTSGGGKLPESVAKSPKDLELLYEFFSNLPDRSDISINPDLKKILNGTVSDRYLESFVSMARKGLFSFDRTVLNDFSNTNYHLVAAPIEPLKFQQLPIEIRSMLIKYRYDSVIKAAIDVNLIS